MISGEFRKSTISLELLMGITCVIAYINAAGV